MPKTPSLIRHITQLTSLKVEVRLLIHQRELKYIQAKQLIHLHEKYLQGGI